MTLLYLKVRDGHSSDFRKLKKQNWITANNTKTNALADDHGAAEADAILAQASREHEAQDEEDNAPTALVMESGARAGLQTAAQVAASLKKKREADLAAMAALDPSGASQETIYRDASGRIVNVAMARAEARRQAAEAAAKAAADKLRLKGQVQLLAAAERKKNLEDAKFKTLARYKDDLELNEELKTKERWDDPAFAFLTKKDAGRSTTGKPLYQGPWEPNRFGIRPGHGWDGVDRATGFEKKWFEARGKRAARQELEHHWEMDE